MNCRCQVEAASVPVALAALWEFANRATLAGNCREISELPLRNEKWPTLFFDNGSLVTSHGLNKTGERLNEFCFTGLTNSPLKIAL